MQNNAKICVGGAVKWKDKYLLLYKPKKKWYEFPGGKLEKGETASEGAVREVFEETGLTLKIDKIAGLFSFTSNIITMIYIKFLMISEEEKEPEVILSKEHSEYHWLSINDIIKKYKNDLSPMLLKYIENMNSEKINDLKIC